MEGGNDQELRARLAAAVDVAVEAASRDEDTFAAQTAMITLRAASGDDVFPSVYRFDGQRLWLVAQAGYSDILDGFSPSDGVLGKAVRTGETQWIPDTSADPIFWEAQPGFVSEISVPRGRYVFNVETSTPLTPESVADVERFASAMGRILGSASSPSGVIGTARSLATMASLTEPVAIAEYACRLVGQLLDLEVAQAVVTTTDGPITVFWRRPGSEGRPAPESQVIGAIEWSRTVTSRLGSRPPGFTTWPGFDRFLVLPIRRHGHSIGGIVGVGHRLRYDAGLIDVLATVATHTATLLDRVALERELAAAVSARNDFIAAVSHELRTPLTSIVGFTELILDGSTHDPVEVKEFLNSVRDNAAHLLDLINEILDTARAEAGKLAVATDQQVDLSRIVDEVVGYVTPQARSRGVTLETRVPDRSVIAGDELRVRQVLVNLVSNALRFSPGGRVTLTLQRVEGFVELTIEDNGAGMDTATLEGLFRPFASSSPASDGTGLGLVISRRIVEALGGSIDLTSPGPGLGTTATVRFPAADDRPEPRS